jgi:hypothetical protein
MARTARQDNPTWETLDDWFVTEEPDRFNVALPRTPQTIRQNFRLVGGPLDRRTESANVPTEAAQFAYMVLNQPDNDTTEADQVSVISEWCAEIKDWDRHDFATVVGIIMACLGFVAALFPTLRGAGILFPVGAALMAFAAYGANRRDAHAD